MKKTIFIGICILVFTGIHPGLYAQSLVLPEGFPEMDINVSEGTSEGYFFLGPMPIGSNTPGCLIIMDDYGTPVFYRKTKNKTYCFQPYPTGNLAFFEGKIFKYLEIDSSYQSIDTMGCVDCDRFDIHELRILEDGGYILAGFKYRILDMRAIVPGGDSAATIQDYVIQEFDENDQLLFEWNTKDHYEITDVNDRVDLTASVIDPTSFCSIEVESDTSLIMSMAHQDEITKVDRRTGDVIWRMGGKNNQFTFVNSTRPFTRQHDARKLPNGNIIVFDDGTFSTPFYSRAVEYEINEDSMTAKQVWEFDHGKTIQSTHKGSVQRLPNGNTLIGWGGFGTNPAVPSATEVKPDGTIVFEVSTPQHDNSYRIRKFPWKTNLFEPVVDSVNFGNWNGYTESVYQLMIKNNSVDDSLIITSAALRTSYFYVDEQFPIVIPANEQEILNVIFYPVGAAQNTKLSDVLTINSDSQDTIQRIAIQVHLQGYVPDLISPVASFIPADDTLSREGVIKIQFSEPVRNLDDSEITGENASALVIYAEEYINGPSVSFGASINEAKTEITVTPSTLLKSKQPYYIQISSVEDSAGNPSMTASKIYTTEYFVSSKYAVETDLWKIYPNPVNNLLYIICGNEFRYRIELFNITGEILLSKEMMQGRTDIDMTGMPPGAYLIKITADEMSSVLNRMVVKY